MEDTSVDEHEDGSSGEEEEGVLRSRDSEDDQPGGSGHIYYAISDERKSKENSHAHSRIYLCMFVISGSFFQPKSAPLMRF